jgi:hypothetical protein
MARLKSSTIAPLLSNSSAISQKRQGRRRRAGGGEESFTMGEYLVAAMDRRPEIGSFSWADESCQRRQRLRLQQIKVYHLPDFCRNLVLRLAGICKIIEVFYSQSAPSNCVAVVTRLHNPCTTATICSLVWQILKNTQQFST